MANDSIRSLGDELPRHGTWVRRLARSLVRDDARADDVAQEAALAALRDRQPGDDGLGPWLVRVTRNFARKDRRGEQRRGERERAAARPEGLPAVDEALARLEEQRKLVEALAELEPAVRQVVVRRYLDGWSCARIARASGEPAATVRWRLQKGLTELRARLDRASGGDGVRWRLALLPLCERAFPWPPLEHAFRPAAGATTVSGVLLMKATLQVLAATLALAAVGLSVWFAVERGDGEHAPERAPVSALEPGAGETDALPRIEIEAPLAALSERAVVPSEHHEAPVAPEAAHEARVAGRCVDDALLPLANVRISQADPARPNAARSAGDGRFSLVVEPSVLHDAVLRFELAGKATRLVKLTLQAGASEELGDVRLEPGDVLRGLVLGPDGRPFPEALVSVTSPELYGSLEEAETRGPLAADLVAHSGPDGRFEVSGVPLTPVRAWASAEGMRHAISTPLRVQEAPPELVLTLEPLRREDRLRGIVLTPTGEPVPGARLSIVARGGGGYSMYDEHADDAGRFDLEAEPGKAYDLGAHDPLDRFAEVQALGLAPGARDIELVFEPAQFIEVEVRARDGGALERFALAADPLDASGDVLRRAQEEEHPGGTARLRARTRAFLVQVEARGFAPARQGPFPPDALPARLRFELEPAPGVRGRVLADGHPLAGARVSLHDASPGLYIQSQGFESTRNRYAEDKTTTDAQGRFVLQLHDTGSFVVRAEADGFAPGDAGPLTLDPRAGHELELVLVRGGALEGRVHLAPGHDPEGFIVGLNRGDGFPHTVRADADGHFRFEGLMSGPWQLARATSEFNPEQSGGAYATRADWALPTNVIVVAGETVHADLDLSDLVPGVLDGRLTVNGSPATDWVVRAWPRGVSAFSGTLPTSALDADGRFHFEFEEPGARRLSFTPAPELGLDGTIDLEAEVRAGSNSWSFDLACGEVAGRCPPLAQGVELALCSPRDSSASFQLTLRPDSNDRYFVPYVPAGPVELHRYSWPDGQYRDELLGELVVRAGAAHTLDLP